MNLPDYIAKVGDAKAARQFGVSERTAMSWRLRERCPTRSVAKRIIQKSPVTYEGIYSPDVKAVRRADVEAA